MNLWPALVAAGFTVLLSAAPAQARVVEGDPPAATPSVVRIAPPELRLPAPDAEGCILPVSTRLAPCRSDPRRPLVSCVVPVERGPGVLVPACPRHLPSPEGRVVPVGP